MKTLKISLFILIPALTMGLVYTSLYHFTGSYLGHIHDVYASNTQSGLIPIMWVISGFLGALPMFFYIGNLLFTPIVLTEQEVNQVEAILTTTEAPIHIGQVFSSIGSNCQLRVKEIKNIFAGLKEDQFGYILETSLY